jgi:hypothetical protein
MNINFITVISRYNQQQSPDDWELKAAPARIIDNEADSPE